MSDRNGFWTGGGVFPLLLLLFFVPVVDAAEERDFVMTEKEDAIVLEPLEVEAEQEIERSILDLERSFEEPFIRERVFSDKIEQESIPDVKAALKDLPNVSVRESGAFTKEIKIRGLSGDRIISVVDGVRLSNQGMTRSGGGDINLVDISTVEVIEVVKGSPAVVYDPGATGGVILVETKDLTEKDHLNLKYTFGYDGGLEKTKHATTLSASKKGFGAALSYSRTDADAYKVRNQGKLEAVIRRTNILEDRLGTPVEIRNLGFEDESLTLKLSARLTEHQRISFQHSDYAAEDISSTRGGVDSTIFHIDSLSRKSHQVRYQIKDMAFFQAFSLSFADQDLVRNVNAFTTKPSILESRNINVSGVIPIHQTKLSIGGEFVLDEADTQVLSEQDYVAAYVSAEHVRGALTYLAGIRANQWRVQAKVPEGREFSNINDFVHVEGQFNPETGEFEDINKTAFTYAVGLVYDLNASNKVSLNMSRTYRSPSLFERFATDSSIGCGLRCQPEEADNIDAAWKFYDGLFFASVSVFYSDFDNYLTSKKRSRIIRPLALAECIRQGRCDALNGNFDNREDAFFENEFPFFNVKRLVNRGFELSFKRVLEEDYEVAFNVGLNDFDVRAVYETTDEDLVITDANPLEFAFSIKRYFSDWAARPWVKFKGRYVTDTPRVKQVEGFSSFFVADLFAGFKFPAKKYAGVRFNAGIRNLTDKVYHEPFSALDGLKRSFFFNLSFEIG